MCFAPDAQPPDLPPRRRLAGGAAAERLTLTSADGTRFSAAIAPSPAPAGPGVVILPDVRGLYPFYERLAERFAEAGHDAIVVDPFGRTAGFAPREDPFDFVPHVLAAELGAVGDDVAAAIAALRGRTGATEVVVVGFCFGGTAAYLIATLPELGLAGAVGFYGGMDTTVGGMKLPSPVDRAPQTVVPVLALFAGEDRYIPPERREAYAAALERSGAPFEIHVYPGAPHSFFDRSFARHAEASADAWERVLDFLGRVASTSGRRS